MILVECYDFDTIIEAVVDGAVPQEVWGHIISPSIISGIKIGTTHIPTFAMAHSQWHFKDGNITLKGIFSLFDSIVHVFETYQFVGEHIDELKYIYQIIKVSVYIEYFHEIILSDDALRIIRRKLRKKLKQNILSIREYESEVRIAKKSNERYYHVQWRIQDKLREYLNDKYNIHLSFSLLPQFIDKYI